MRYGPFRCARDGAGIELGNTDNVVSSVCCNSFVDGRLSTVSGNLSSQYKWLRISDGLLLVIWMGTFVFLCDVAESAR